MENLFNKYSINSIVLEGKGVDRFISYMEKEDGTPLTEEEMDNLHHDSVLHSELIQAKLQ